MEAQYKSATRKAQQLTKDTPQEEINQMLAAMTVLKEHLCQVSEDSSRPSLFPGKQQSLFQSQSLFHLQVFYSLLFLSYCPLTRIFPIFFAYVLLVVLISPLKLFK